MNLGFETIGNATLICFDYNPILVTDPWIKGSAYFGSWVLSHEIPEEQMRSIHATEYIWLSHGHPDPPSALCDAATQLSFDEFISLLNAINPIWDAIND